jgi:hypothetical protein
MQKSITEAVLDDEVEYGGNDVRVCDTADAAQCVPRLIKPLEHRLRRLLYLGYGGFISEPWDTAALLPAALKIDLSKIFGSPAKAKEFRYVVKDYLERMLASAKGGKPSLLRAKYGKSDAPCHLSISMMCAERDGQTDELQEIACGLLKLLKPIIDLLEIEVVDINVLAYVAYSFLFAHHDNDFKYGQDVTLILEIYRPKGDKMPTFYIKDKDGKVIKAVRGDSEEHMMNAFYMTSRENIWVKHFVATEGAENMRALVEALMKLGNDAQNPQHLNDFGEMRWVVALFGTHRRCPTEELPPGKKLPDRCANRAPGHYLADGVADALTTSAATAAV